MKFARQDLAKFEAIELRLPSTGETAFVLPELGGSVYSITLGKSLTQILDLDQADELSTNPKFRGRLLFPFNDRIPNAEYTFAAKHYKLPVNCPEDGSAIHGLIYNRTMDVIREEQSADSARLVLATAFGAHEFQGYPFALTFEVEYLLQPGTLTLKFRISNDGENEAPIALGWHPYFQLGTASVDEHELCLPAKGYVEVDEALLPTGNIPSCDGSDLDFAQFKPIGKLELDHAFEHSGSAEAFFRLGSKQLKMSQDPEFFPYFQLYIPETRRSLALEPVSGATDSFNRPALGLKTLVSGAEIRTWCKIELSEV